MIAMLTRDGENYTMLAAENRGAGEMCSIGTAPILEAKKVKMNSHSSAQVDAVLDKLTDCKALLVLTV